MLKRRASQSYEIEVKGLKTELLATKLQLVNSSRVVKDQVKIIDKLKAELESLKLAAVPKPPEPTVKKEESKKASPYVPPMDPNDKPLDIMPEVVQK